MISVDIETTGVDPRRAAIVSIGGIEVESPDNTFYAECRTWEGAEMHPGAFKVQGFTVDEVQSDERQSQKEAIKEFLKWATSCEKHTLAGHNEHFDLYFLEQAAIRCGLNWSLGHRVIDNHTLLHAHMVRAGKTPPTSKGRTDIDSAFVQEYVGLPEEPTPHHALTGAKYEAEVISRILHGKNLLDEFSDYPIPDYLE